MFSEITQSDMRLQRELTHVEWKRSERSGQRKAGQDIQQASTGCIAVRVADLSVLDAFRNHRQPTVRRILCKCVQPNGTMIQPVAPFSARVGVGVGLDLAGLAWWHGTVYEE